MFITSISQAKELIEQNKDKIKDLKKQQREIREQLQLFKDAQNLIKTAILVNDQFGLFVNNEEALNDVEDASFERTVGKRDYRPRIDISCSLESEILSFEFEGYLESGHEDTRIKLSLTIHGKLKQNETIVCKDGSIIKIQDTNEEYPIKCSATKNSNKEQEDTYMINDQEVDVDQFKKIEFPPNINDDILNQDFMDELQHHIN